METEAIRENTSPRTKGLLGRLRRNKNPERTSGKSQVSASPIATVSAGQSVTREGVPVLTSKNADQFNPSDAHQTEPSPKVGVFRRKNRTRQEMILEKPPAARESAFSGPPRYDWIDIVSKIAVPLHLLVVGWAAQGCRNFIGTRHWQETVPESVAPGSRIFVPVYVSKRSSTVPRVLVA